MVQELMTSTLSFDRTVRTAESPTYGRYGCLGHGSDECDSVPKAVEALSNVKAIHVVAGDYTTFVVFDDGDVYSFGCGQSASLGHNAVGNDE
ncbi:Putative E3 ubiquitin-protein ligase HERC2 [Glycine soja]|uniref:Putative E3 ubiquitin-protein ligase HERC2 n=1 Tax=Glycine soja TaxID=3848 RepID=A0A0B2P2Z1_GLYSO|nr:Putative E3 ubiquitin-protein ligase HERC2 [Glycine soja]